MNLLSRHSDYAVQSLCYMFQTDAVVSAKEICQELGLPLAFMRGILQKLAAHKIIVSIKGKGGGFRPLLEARQIPITRIVKIFQGPLTLSACLFRKSPCPRRIRCTLRRELKKLEATVVSHLDSTTIADLS